MEINTWLNFSLRFGAAVHNFLRRFEVGEQIELLAGKGEKRGEIEFYPSFVEFDEMVGEEWSVRIFVINESANAKHEPAAGELWLVEITKITIAAKARSRDGRRLIFFAVSLLHRIEREEIHFSNINNELFCIRLIQSGIKEIERKKISVEKRKKLYRDRAGNTLIPATEYIHDGKIMKIIDENPVHSDAYFRALISQLGKNAPTKFDVMQIPIHPQYFQKIS